MAGDKNPDAFETGGVFTFGRSRFAEDTPSQFYIRNDPVVGVACGDEHTVCICQKGRVFVFGANDYGQLGLGHKNVVIKPTCIKVLKPMRAQLVACGRAHTLLATDEGVVFSWGCNGDGQLGLGDTTDRSQPQRLAQFDGTVVQLSAGSQFSAALIADGRVFVWGCNADGQLGVSDADSALTPRLLVLDVGVVSISCGYYHMALVTALGSLLTCGEPDCDKLGRSPSDGVLAEVSLPAHAVSVSCGGSHTVTLLADGRACAWGSNTVGQTGLGNANLASVEIPTAIEGVRHSLASVACGENHTAFVTRRGRVLFCGDNAHDKLGLGVTTPTWTPQAVERFKGLRVEFVACGGCHSMVLATRREETDSFDENSQTESDSEESAVSVGIRALPPLQRLPAPVPDSNSVDINGIPPTDAADNGNEQLDPPDELRILEDEIVATETQPSALVEESRDSPVIPERPAVSENNSPEESDEEPIEPTAPIAEPTARPPGRVARLFGVLKRKRQAPAQSATERLRPDTEQLQQRASSEVVLSRKTEADSQHRKIAPVTTAACNKACLSTKAPPSPARCVSTPNRPTLKVRRALGSRKGRPGTASRRPGTGMRRQFELGVAVDACFDAVPPSNDTETQLVDTVAKTYFGACSSKLPMKCAVPLLSYLPSTSTQPAPQCTQIRHYSMEKEFKRLVRRNVKPCFAPKKLKDKPQPIDWTSPCACNYRRTIDRCEKARCAPNIIQCRKPYVRPPYQCPKKRKVVRMKKRKPGRKVLLGYKLCTRPARTKMFQCFPKPPPVIPELPTPKRCPCFAPREYDTGPACKKMRGAKQPADCRTRRQPPVCMICPPRK